MAVRHLVDVVIPTQFKPERMTALTHQVKSALNQDIDTRVVILSSKENWEKKSGNFLRSLSDEEYSLVDPFFHPDGKRDDPFNTPDGYMCNPAILAYMESGNLGTWQMHAADDDCLTPWALKSLLTPALGQGMVMGRAIAVNRNHEDKRHYLLGNHIERCHIDLACGIINTECLQSLPRPWMGIESGYEDWNLIERMSTHFSYVLIPQIVSIKPLTL